MTNDPRSHETTKPRLPEGERSSAFVGLVQIVVVLISAIGAVAIIMLGIFAATYQPPVH